MVNTERGRSLILILLTLVGLLLCIPHGLSLLLRFCQSGLDPTLRNVLVPAIALEFSWATLLLWVLHAPLARRQVLAFTALPVLLSNGLETWRLALEQPQSMGGMLLHLVPALLLAVLFLLAPNLGPVARERDRRSSPKSLIRPVGR